MAHQKYAFQYCQKLVLFSEDWSKVFLAKRCGEADYDGTFSFICGKMETTDESILAGLKREKDEEVGADFKVRVYMQATNNVLFHKKDGSTMILPHYIAQYIGGEVHLNREEYSEYRWVPIAGLPELEPKVENIPNLVDWAATLRHAISADQFVEI
jgi:8-oxo-dGTP pyrophosphatase MutT (NUDIX family)